MDLKAFLQKCTSVPLFKVAILIFSVFIVTSHFSATQAFAAQATLAWNAPVNTDGTAVAGLKGYKVHVGTASGIYSQHIDVGNVGTYTLTNLTDGATYYTAVSDYDTSGSESGYSNEVSKALAPAPAANTYTITATAGSGGTIAAVNNTKVNTASNGTSTVTSVTVASGASQSFTITPGTGYTIAAVTADGVSLGAVTSYAFSNVTANHTLQATFTASGTGGTGGTGTTATTTFAVNAGGAAYKDSTGVAYLADTKYSGGRTATAGVVAISGTADPTLYQTERIGNFSYSIPVTNGNYNVTLKFAETYWTVAGKRVFSVSMNGKTVISNLDIYAKVGKGAAYDVVVPVSVTTGTIAINFVTQVDNAKVSAIKVAPASAGSTGGTTPPSTGGQVVFSTNSGGPQFAGSTGTYAADGKFVGGSVRTGLTTADITGTVEDTIYTSERYGDFSYSVPLANGNYAVTLKFAETYWTAAGQRVFDVAINGQAALSNLDIFAKVGKNAAYDVTLPATVTNGILDIKFTTKVNYAKVSAILVKSL